MNIDLLFLCTIFAITIKSILFQGFITNENHLNIFITGGIKGIYSIPHFFSFILIYMSFSYIFRGLFRAWFLVFQNVLISFILIVDLLYFRAFGAFGSLHLLTQTANLENLFESIISLLSIYDVAFVIDITLFIIILIKYPYKFNKRQSNIWMFIAMLLVPSAYMIYTPEKVNLPWEKEKPQHIFKIQWRPDMTLLRLSPIGYHIFDAYIYWKDSKIYVLTEQDTINIQEWFENKKENIRNNKYYGYFKGKNLLYIQFESLENFVINRNTASTYIITPNLNKMIKNSIYIPNIQEQINLGSSSDADFMVNTSVYPLRRGSTFFRYPTNTYHSFPKILKKYGYSTVAIHPDKGSYWNWRNGLINIGFEKCIDSSNFIMDEIIQLGLSDGSYLRQALPIVLSQKKPFYIFMVTMSSHTPFKIPEKYSELNLPESIKRTKLGGYFQSLHYTDKHIGLFLSGMEKSGLLDNTVVVISGDHCGIHKFFPNEIHEINKKEDWWVNNHNHVPLIVYYKNMTGEMIELEGGQIDIMPTLLYLMGIEEGEYINSAMGRNLLKTNKNYAVSAKRTVTGEGLTEKDKEEAIRGLDMADIIIRSNYFSNR